MKMSEPEPIRITDYERFTRIVLASPPHNILDIRTLQVLNSRLEDLTARAGLCAIVIEAEGANFSAGVDVPEHRAETVSEMLRTFHTTIRLVHEFPAPVIAAVQGGAYGGGMELTLAADIVLAADDLKIGVPEITLGVYPPVAMVLLGGTVGYHRAAEMILMGRILAAEEALSAGLVNAVFPAALFRDKVDEFVMGLTRLSSFSLGQSRKALRRAAFPEFERLLQATESSYLNDLMSGQDPAEGLRSFMEKRKPKWSDR